MAHYNNPIFINARPQLLQNHYEWAERQWKDAFDDDRDFENLLYTMRAKLTTMARYFKTLSYKKGRFNRGKQMDLAIKLIDIVATKGGHFDYKDINIPDSYKHIVNMRNRDRIPRASHPEEYIRSEAQRLRYDKAWMLLWRLFSEKMMYWSDC